MAAIENKLFLAGQFVDSPDGQSYEFKGALGKETIATVQEAGEKAVEQAVEAAEKAWRPWSDSAATRATVLNKWADLIVENAGELGRLDALQMGKPVSFATYEAHLAAGHIRHFASLALFTHGETSLSNADSVNITLRQPYGVVAGIIPWNFTCMMAVWKIGPALAAGNALILKSSEKAPLSPLLLAKLAKEAGVPDGVLSVLSGHGQTGKLLAEHQKIRKIAFTGSTATGRLIQQGAAKSNLKVVTLELGGKSPVIIFGDADLSHAAQSTAMGLLPNSGQICVAGTRVYIEKKAEKEFTEKLVAAFSAFKAGDPSDPSTTHGPVADELQGKRVGDLLEAGKSEGKIAVGGNRIKDAGGWSFEPTIFTDVPDNGRINKEEIFGPVLILHAFDTEAEVIARANDTEYGLASAVYTNDLARALRVAKQLEAGTVGVNAATTSQASDMPFGGWKTSGIGHELGSNAVKNWTQVKSVFLSVPPAQ